MSNEEKICKAILIGESGVGKTCIILRLIDGKFFNDSISTIGACYSSTKLHFSEFKKDLQFQIWDTAGQEKFRGITRIFYTKAEIVILVYDITNRRSFDEIKNYWYKQILENSSEQISKYFFM